MDPLKIIEKYYIKDSQPYYWLVEHSKSVTKKALQAAHKVKHLSPDYKFIEEAAMLHDIGIIFTYAPENECLGDKPYICHGYLGREILEKEGLPKHALVAERHIHCGITKDEIIKNNLPLPPRDMVPIYLEEQIINYADRFYSKIDKYLYDEKSVEEIIKGLIKYGEEKVIIFKNWHKIFN